MWQGRLEDAAKHGAAEGQARVCVGFGMYTPGQQP